MHNGKALWHLEGYYAAARRGVVGTERTIMVKKEARLKLPTLLFFVATLATHVYLSHVSRSGNIVNGRRLTSVVNVDTDLKTIRSDNRTVSQYVSAQGWKPPDLPEDIGGRCRCVDCEEDVLCGGLWKANRFPPSVYDTTDLQSKKIHIVVSHCNRDLHWISNFTQGYEIASIHIISKCGEPTELELAYQFTNWYYGFATSGLPNATVEVLPNVGRCDHSYAYYIANVLDQKIVPGEEMDSIVVFLKDDMSEENLHQQGQWATFDSMVQIASSANGFACGVDVTTAGRYWPRLTWSYSAYHNIAALSQFQMKDNPHNRTRGYKDDGVEFTSGYTNFSHFYNTITDGKQRSLPELAQVCYGGVFAASYQNIKRIDPLIWQNAQNALSRGNNIEEGHHMERCWGSLLATPLHQYQIKAIRKYSTTFMRMGNEEHLPTQPGMLFRFITQCRQVRGMKVCL